MKRRFFLTLLLLTFVAGMSVMARASQRDYGYPAHLHLADAGDRAVFREWFATIAEAQYTAIHPDWVYQDCSGLLRFAYTQALTPKTAEWFASFAYLPRVDIPPVRGLSYPMPEISRSVFRIFPGAYEPGDVQAGKLVGLATSAELMHYNTVLLGRGREVARRGDLLFFAHPTAEGSGYHSMVYLGGGMIVYHTGLTPEQGGEVRLLSLETLARHPDPSWHPRTDNPHFLGFYRWKIAY